jgi:thioredoxin-related protein
MCSRFQRNFREQWISAQVSSVDWSKNEKTLVMAVSSTCHFCTESAPFYRDIRARTRVHTIAVLPQSVYEGRNYLSSLGVQVDEVLQAPLNSIDVNGTPTLILVGRDGTVIRTWLGKLPPDLEKEVLLSVGAES